MSVSGQVWVLNVVIKIFCVADSTSKINHMVGDSYNPFQNALLLVRKFLFNLSTFIIVGFYCTQFSSESWAIVIIRLVVKNADKEQ